MGRHEFDFIVDNECDEDDGRDDVWFVEVDISTHDVRGEYSMGHQEMLVECECSLVGAESEDGIKLSPESWRRYLRDAGEWLDLDDWMVGEAMRLHGDSRCW